MGPEGTHNGARRDTPSDRAGTPARILNAAALVVVLATAPLAWLALDGLRPNDIARASSSTPAPAVVGSPAPSSHFSDTGQGATPVLTVAPAPTLVYGDGRWTVAAMMSRGIWGAGAAVLPDGRVLVVGGATSSDSHAAVATAATFDPKTGAWQAATSMLQARAYPMVVALKDGSILVAGGSRNGSPLDSAERFVPDTGTWLAAGRMHLPRTHATATLLQDGRVLVAGGGSTGRPDYSATATADLFDPHTGAWSAAASMSVPRTLHAAALLPTGEVLVMGGSDVYYTQGSVYASAEIYDPTTHAWRAAASMSSARYGESALATAGGLVVVAGGWSATAASSPSLPSAEAYDPIGNVWTPAGSMSVGRAQFRMTALADGRLLAVGGVSPKQGPLAAVDLFDPKTLTWRAASPLPQAVYWPILIRLGDGRILVAGGAANSQASTLWSGAALYAPAAP